MSINRKTYPVSIIALVGVMLVLVLAACAPQQAGPEATAPGTEPSAPQTEEPAAETAEATEALPPTGGIGGYDELVSALEAAGAAVEPAGEVDEPFFGVEGRYIQVDGEQVQVYEFADEAAREAAAATISANGYIIGTAAVDWISQPYFFSTGRVIVLYVGTDESLIGLLTDVLGEPITRPQAPATEDPAPADGTAELIDQLRAAGATVEPAGEIEQAFFEPVGQMILVNGAEVQVFEYPDETAREAESSQISPDGSSIGTIMVTWVDDPHFWAVGRTIVLYVGSDEATLDLLRRVLGEPIAG